MWHKPYNPKDETCHHVVQSVCLSQELSYFVCVCLCTWLCHFQNAVYREVHLSYFHRFNHACLKKQGILQSAQKGQSLIERVGRDSCRHTLIRIWLSSLVVWENENKTLADWWIPVSSESSLYFRHCLHLFCKQHWHVNIFLECLETAPSIQNNLTFYKMNVGAGVLCILHRHISVNTVKQQWCSLWYEVNIDLLLTVVV